jgi:Protein of unknown function (DUF4232)
MKILVPPAVLALLLAGACQPAGPQPPVAVNHVHATPTPVPTPADTTAPGPSPTPAATPVAPVAGDRCHTGGLRITFAGSQGAMGTIVNTFRVANTVEVPCTLFGFVGMLMLDDAGHPLPTRVVRSGGIFSTQGGPARFLLGPGTPAAPSAGATFQAAWSDVPHGSEGPCPQAAQLEITPPDETDHVVLPVSGWSLAPCAAGEIDVTPMRAVGA